MITASILHIHSWDMQLLQGCWYLYNSINLDSALQIQYVVVAINSRAVGQNFQLFLVFCAPQMRYMAQVKELEKLLGNKKPHVSLCILNSGMEG